MGRFRSIRLITVFIPSAGLLMLGNSVALAQSQGLFGGRGTTSASSGALGSRGLGTSSSSGSMFGQSGFGASSYNRGGTGLQTPGANMLGGLGGLNGQSLSNQTSTLVGNGFVGRADNTGDFIGRRATNGDGRQLGRNNNRTNFRNLRARQGQGRNNANSTNDANASANRDRAIRVMTQHRIAFDQKVVPSSAVETKLAARFDAPLQKRLNASDLNFKLDPNGVLTMRGTVPTTTARDLAETIVRMEPGVNDVRNELTVPAAR
jgi:hypothetical protein